MSTNPNARQLTGLQLSKTKEYSIVIGVVSIALLLSIGGFASAGKLPADDKLTDKEKELKKDTQWYLIVAGILGIILLVFSFIGHRWYRHLMAEITASYDK